LGILPLQVAMKQRPCATRTWCLAAPGTWFFLCLLSAIGFDDGGLLSYVYDVYVSGFWLQLGLPLVAWLEAFVWVWQSMGMGMGQISG
jgi:hypothetical protein